MPTFQEQAAEVSRLGREFLLLAAHALKVDRLTAWLAEVLPQCENRPGGQGGNGPGGPSGTRPGGGSNPGGNPPPAGPGRPKG